MEQGKASPFLNGVLIGAALGAVAFFVLGTKEGSKSKQKILKQGKTGLKKLAAVLEELEEKKEEIFNEGRTAAKKIITQVAKELPSQHSFFKKGKKLIK